MTTNDELRKRAESDPQEAWASEVADLLRKAADAARENPQLLTKLPIEDRRGLLADRIRRLQELTIAQAEELADALEALNSGQVNDLLRPSKRRRKGKRPHDRTEVELSILEWRAFRIATGEREEDVEEELAKVIGRTPELFAQWRHVSLPKEISEERLQSTLAEAERLGHAVAAGQPLNLPEKQKVGMWQEKEGAYLGRLADGKPLRYQSKGYLRYLADLFKYS